MAPITASSMVDPSLRPPGSNAMSSVLNNMQKLNIKENYNAGGIGTSVQNEPSHNANVKAVGGKKVGFQIPPVQPVGPLKPVTNRHK
ncbi:hypothetical protein SPBR_05437 [Sporothrix brasiliensis 5110]|uniref:Uncharacterized protein n=1 Tax=Sporothrix brasiliensis 5110 TaxID=1398154 RepID=A0A0C2IK77_9PEZI|nr:uncharacterized protein SPBR_05437 [Sporothrix brasiliensis 5110]KIH87385.1 hypothetical protein SPBR_05437 [Sporothrix brasiliensis 5110]